ncbi:MAG: transcriptional regulator NrdR [Ktedonobacterales bacterium]
MQCPYCGFRESRVIDSRDSSGVIQRRRRCEHCFQRFSTVERVVLPELMVVKHDGRREPFDRKKLETGLRHACQKRPIAVGQLEALVEDIENELYKLGKAEVEARVIGELLMERLRKLDAIAYIRFASVYRSYPSLQAMRQEIDHLLESATPDDNASNASNSSSRPVPDDAAQEQNAATADRSA